MRRGHVNRLKLMSIGSESVGYMRAMESALAKRKEQFPITNAVPIYTSPDEQSIPLPSTFA